MQWRNFAVRSGRVLTALAVLISAIVGLPARALAATTPPPPPPCAKAYAQGTVLVNTRTQGGKLQAGVTREYTVPDAWKNPVALLGEVVVDSTGSAVVAASSTASDERIVLEGPAGATTAPALIPVAGGKFKLTARSGSMHLVLRIRASLIGPGCFTAVEPTTLVDTAVGGTPVSEGADLDIPLGTLVAPDNLDIGLVGFAVRNVGPDVAKVDLYDADGLPFARRFVTPGRTATFTEFIPPTGSGTLRVRVTDGPVDVRAVALGWMPQGIPLTSERSVLTASGPIDARTLAGLAKEGDGSVAPAPGTATPPVTKLELPFLAQDAATVYIATTLRPAVGQQGSLKVWKSDVSEPANPTISSVVPGVPLTEIIAVQPAPDGTISARPTAGWLRWSLTVVGWESRAARLNQAVDDAKVLPADAVTLSTAPSGGQVLQYAGTKTLEPGDVVAAAASETNRKGLLAKVSGSATTGSDGVQTMAIEPATLADALPYYSFSQTRDVGSAAVPPMPAPEPLPPAGGGTTASPSRAASSQGSIDAALDTGVQNPCSGGVAGSVQANVQLTGRVIVSGSKSRSSTIAPSAQFDFDGDLDGWIAADSPSRATCRGTLTPVSARLGLLSFNVGGIPVVLDPVATLQVKADFETGEAMTLRQSGASGLKIQMHYKDGAWTDSISAQHSLQASFAGRLGASGRVEARVSFDTLFYSSDAQGGWHVDIGPYSEFAAVPTDNPWWAIDGGVYSGGRVDFKALGIGLDISRTVSTEDRAESRSGVAPGAFPGPSIANERTLPSGNLTVAYNQSLSASGGVAPYKWKLDPGSRPPSGLDLTEGGNVTGTPTQTGSFTFYAYPVDANGNRTMQSQKVNIAIGAAPDQDGDGVIDRDDRCINTPGPRENNGCPWPNADGDPFLDKDDPCPNEYGQYNGCPPRVTVEWAGKASSSTCGGDTSCSYFTVRWYNMHGGGHSIKPLFDGQGNWCGGSRGDCPASVSGSSGSYGNFWAAGYCNQNRYVKVLFDNTWYSNEINTNDHAC
jgi:hypothetical protein